MLVGAELWNEPHAGTEDQWVKLWHLGVSALKIRPYHPLEVVHRGLSLNPDMVFLLRRSADGPIEVGQQVTEVRRYYDYCRERRARLIYLLDSEPQHERNANRARGLGAYLADLRRLIDALSAEYPDLPLCAPPMAVWQDDLEWLQAVHVALIGLRVAYRGCHLYWQYDNVVSADWGRRIEQYATMAPDQRWIAAELGDSTPGKPASSKADSIIWLLRYLAGRGDVEMACLFLPVGGTPEWSGYFLPEGECRRVGEVVREVRDA